MARAREFINKNVYEEAKNRIHHIFDVFDDVVIMFSGGKDSLVLLNLAREVSLERGIKKVNVVFLDEELIFNSVIEFVIKHRELDWINMYYYAVPLHSKKYILGKNINYIQWDKNRENIRKPPDFAITLKNNDDRVFNQYTIHTFLSENFKGRIAYLTGIRANESITRYRSSVNKLNENYINKPSRDEYRKIKRPVPSNFMLCKPIFDWCEEDIFKYLYENQIEYCGIYDMQLWGGKELRVSTPLSSESSKKFNLLRTIDPVLYEQILSIFPEMVLQERYYSEFNFEEVRDKYSVSISTIKQWIDENIIDEVENALANKRLKTIEVYQKNKPEYYQNREILSYFMSGAYKRAIVTKVNRKKNASK